MKSKVIYIKKIKGKAERAQKCIIKPKKIDKYRSHNAKMLEGKEKNKKRLGIKIKTMNIFKWV